MYVLEIRKPQNYVLAEVFLRILFWNHYFSPYMLMIFVPLQNDQKIRMYADGVQLYISSRNDPSAISECVDLLNADLQNISDWA